MAEPHLVFGSTGDEMQDSPIPGDWVLAGAPRARNRLVAMSADRLATTYLWECTAGRFRWVYDTDETIHILDGGVRLTDSRGVVRDLGPGDVVFFPQGSTAEWVIASHVRKIAFFRQAAPKPLSLVIRASRKLRNMVRPPSRERYAFSHAPGKLPQMPEGQVAPA